VNCVAVLFPKQLNRLAAATAASPQRHKRLRSGRFKVRSTPRDQKHPHSADVKAAGQAQFKTEAEASEQPQTQAPGL